MYFTETFLSFIKVKNNGLVKLILEDCGLYDAADANGITLLHYATEYNNIEIAKYLVGKSIKINTQDSKGRTPLMVAVRKNRNAIMKMLLTAGADIAIQDFDGEDVLNIVCNKYPNKNILVPLFDVLKKKYSKEEIAKMFVDYGCGADIAVHVKDAEIIEYMIKRGVSIQCCPLNKKYPLHNAVFLSDVETVKLLIKNGADIEARNPLNATPLFYLYFFDNAQNSEKLEILKIFLDLGASLTTCTSLGLFQISSILVHGNSQEVSLMLQSGIDCTAKNSYCGETILHRLAKNTNPGIVEALKPHIHKFDINAADDHRYKPVHNALMKGNVEMVKFLLNHGAESTTALFYAYCTFDKDLAHLHDECTELLFQYNADPQMIFHGKTGQQYTIFDIARDEKYFDRMKLALAELAIREKQGIMISEDTYSKINAYPPFKTYYKECQELLRKEIAGSVSVFGLVTANEEKMSKYLNNGELVRQLRRLIHKEELSSTSRYYSNTLKIRVSNGVIKRKLKIKAARVVCNIFGNRFSVRDIATEKIINYLNHKDLRQLYHV